MSAFNTDDVRRTWQEKYDKLQQENERLHEDNERLSARVVSLSQGEYQITDDKITKKYREIRDGIDLWIDELQDGERRDFRTNYQAVLKHKDRENMFHDLGFKAGCLDEKWEEQLGRLETCIYVILGMVIAQLLKNEIFLRNYPAGVTETQIRVLDKIHNAMVSSPQSKGTRFVSSSLHWIALKIDTQMRRSFTSGEEKHSQPWQLLRISRNILRKSPRNWSIYFERIS